MPWIKSSATYDIFRADRQITEALHNEDGASGEVIAWVEASRAGDVEINEAAYQAIAETIKTHNGTLPVSASMQEIKEARETDREAKRARIQTSLDLTDDEWSDLKDALDLI
jgi:lipid A disaccharide synthetase